MTILSRDDFTNYFLPKHAFLVSVILSERRPAAMFGGNFNSNFTILLHTYLLDITVNFMMYASVRNFKTTYTFNYNANDENFFYTFKNVTNW